MALDFLKVKNEDAVLVEAGPLRRQVAAIFRALDVPERDAEITADILVESDLRGVDSHGAGNVVGYASMIQSGRCKARADFSVLSESPSAALMTCDQGLGFVAAYRGMEIAIEKAADTGMGAVTIRDGHHIGMVGYYPLMAVEHDMIGMAMTNGGKSTRPALGARPMLGTNPIAFAAPAGEENPFLFDAATSVTAAGKLGIARRLGVEIPAGWAADAEGDPILIPPPTRDDSWSQLPLGGDRLHGSHKGYGLGLIVDILTGVLSGGGYSSTLSQGQNMTFVMAIDIAKFRPVDEFKEMMDEMIRDLHSVQPEPGEERVLVAGDPEHEAYRERSANGIPLHQTLVDSMRDKAREVGAEVLI